MDYIDTYYRQFHRHEIDPWPVLKHNIKVDCCIIGGGIAGLSVARELTDKGLSVALLESHRIAWGASGRNGGFVSPGFAQSYAILKKNLGSQHAAKLYQLSIDGVEKVQININKYRMENVWQSEGELDVIRYNQPDLMKSLVNSSNSEFGLQRRFIDRSELQSGLCSDSYHAGMLQPEAFQIHPLNYCLQLASSVDTDGGLIFEQSQALSIEHYGDYRLISCSEGTVRCRDVVHCSSAYTSSLEPTLQNAILPISTHVSLTHPLGNKRSQVMPEFKAVLDNRRASDYYRLVENDRLLWGGCISTVEPRHSRLEKLMTDRIQQVFPQLSPIKLDLCWTGKMAYSTHKMPHVGKIRDNVWVCTAFGGHGLNTASICGSLIGKAIAENDEEYHLFDDFDLNYNYGAIGMTGVQLTYWYYQLRDWFDENISRNPV